MELRLQQIAEMLGGACDGDGNIVIRSVSSIDEAHEGHITFFANKKYLKALCQTKASAVLVSQKQALDIAQVIVPDSYAAFGKLLGIFYPRREDFSGISGKAFIEEGAFVASDAVIFPFACVRRGARVGSRAKLYPGVYLAPNASVGDESVLYANVVVYDGCLIGKRVVIHAGAVVGADGFGFAQPGVSNTKIPQVGIVQIEDDCEIGANVTIDRGVMGRTWIQRNVKIDNLVQIAHNVVVGENSVIAAQTGIAGSAKIGASNIIGGQVGIVGHITIADNVTIAGRTGVHKNLPPLSIVAGSPQREYQRWLRTEAVISRLPELKETIISLQKRVDDLEEIIKKDEGQGRTA